MSDNEQLTKELINSLGINELLKRAANELHKAIVLQDDEHGSSIFDAMVAVLLNGQVIVKNFACYEVTSKQTQVLRITITAVSGEEEVKEEQDAYNSLPVVLPKSKLN